MPMQPNEIFDDRQGGRVEYATADKTGKRTQQARDLLTEARDAARESELAAGAASGAATLDLASLVAQLRNAVRRTTFCSSITCSSVRVPVARTVISICRRYAVHPSHAAEVGLEPPPQPAPQAAVEVAGHELHQLLAGQVASHHVVSLER